MWTKVFEFSRSLCSCGSFLLPCSHGFRQSFSRSRKGGPMYLYYPLERTKRRMPMSSNSLAVHFALHAAVYHKLYLSEALGGWIYCRNGCFTRFAGCRCCSSGRHCAVRVAAAGNCTQSISQPASTLAGFRKSGSLIRLPCRWKKHWVAIRYIKIAKLYHFFLEGVSFWGEPCGLYIMGGIFSAAKFPSDSPNF